MTFECDGPGDSLADEGKTSMAAKARSLPRRGLAGGRPMAFAGLLLRKSICAEMSGRATGRRAVRRMLVRQLEALLDGDGDPVVSIGAASAFPYISGPV